MNTIEGVEDDEHRAIVRDTYLKTLDIALALSERNRLEELKRREDERKARDMEAREIANAEAMPDTTRPAVMENPMTDAGSSVAHSTAQTDEQAAPQTVAQNVDSAANSPAQNPFTQAKKKRYKASFTVTGSMDDILAVYELMLDEKLGVYVLKPIISAQQNIFNGGYTATETEEPEDASGVFDSYPYEEGETT